MSKLGHIGDTFDDLSPSEIWGYWCWGTGCQSLAAFVVDEKFMGGMGFKVGTQRENFGIWGNMSAGGLADENLNGEFE